MPCYFEEDMGGAELQAMYLVECIDTNYYNVNYVYLSSISKRINNDLNINLHPINKKYMFTKLYDVKFPYAASFYKSLSEINPDIIYNRTCTALTGVSMYFAKKKGIKSVLHIAHDRDVEKKYITWKNPWLRAEFNLIEYGIENAEIIIAQTCFQAQQLRNNYKKKAIVIPNGHPVPDEPKGKDEKITVLWVANWKALKQPEVFVRLVSEIQDRDKYRFVMIGRNEGYQGLVQEARYLGIEVLGEVSNDHVNTCLDQGHILVNTSKSEGFSNTFIQAWLRNVPVVSLHVDPDNVINKEKLGYRAGSFDDLVKKIEYLIKNSDERIDIGINTRNYAKKIHSLENFQKIINEFTC